MSKNKSKEADIPFELNEVTTTSTSVPAVNDYAQYAGMGFETHTREDYAVPFLGVLQSNSPQIENMAEAKPGKLINTVTNDLYESKTGIKFVPVYTDHMFVEWKTRDAGGGFVAQHTLDSEIVKKVKLEQEFGKYKMVKGDVKSNDLIETYYVYGIFVHEDGSSEQMMIAFSSTKVKVYKRWMTKARTIQIQLPDGRRINPPIFAHRYKITSMSEKNSKGSFYNFQIDFDGKDAAECRLPVSDPIFQQAVGFMDLIKQGAVKAAFDTQTSAHEDAAEPETAFK